MKELFQSADWKKEKHIPVIAVDTISKADGLYKISVSVGKEIPHPNTTEHHIASIDVYFAPEGSKFPYYIGRYSCAAHGASVEGPNTSTVYTQPEIEVSFKSAKPGVIHAASYCNIHGLWENSAVIS